MGDLQGSGASANWPRHVNAAEKRRKRDGGLVREISYFREIWVGEIL